MIKITQHSHNGNERIVDWGGNQAECCYVYSLSMSVDHDFADLLQYNLYA